MNGIKQLYAYLLHVRVPASHLHVKPQHANICFRRKDKNRVRPNVVGTICVRIPLPGNFHTDYNSFLVQENIPMLFGLNIQTKLHAVTYKSPAENKIVLRALRVTLPLVTKYRHLYYQFPSDVQFIFSFSKRSQGHKNLGHAPPGTVTGALRRAYTTESSPNDHKKLQEITA